MPCPSCGYVVADHGASQCPNCGRLLAPPLHTAPADPSPTSAGAPLSGQGISPLPDAGAYLSYGSQPSSPTNPT